jgi:hypothetical protein
MKTRESLKSDNKLVGYAAFLSRHIYPEHFSHELPTQFLKFDQNDGPPDDF